MGSPLRYRTSSPRERPGRSCFFAAAAACRGDSVIMKSGIVLPSLGAPDRDNTLVYIWDGVKRVKVRDSRIERVEANNAFRGGRDFKLVQPLVVHGGLMPTDVVSVEAGPWDDAAAGNFDTSARTEQADSNGAGDHRARTACLRVCGVDGFWVGVVETGQLPGEVVISCAPRRAEERQPMRTSRPVSDGHGLEHEAKKELDRMVRDFPQGDLKERSGMPAVSSSRAKRRTGVREMSQARKAQQFKRAAELLKTFR